MKEYFFKERGLYYRTNDFQAGRPTLVFIHGLSGSSAAWLPYDHLFEKKYNLVMFDLRGHGKSAKPKRYADYEFRYFVSDLHALVLHCRLPKFILVSHSYGTLIALEFLAQFQSMVSAAILLSSSYSVRNRKLARAIEPLLSISRVMELFPPKQGVGGHVDYAKFRGTGDWNLRRTIADVKNTSLRVYLYCTRQSYAVDREQFLGHITVPTLLVHGRNDSIFQFKNSVVMSKRIKNSQLIILNNADHILVLNNVRQVAQAIEQFVGKLPV